MSPASWLKLLSAGTLALVVAAFTVQNQARTVDLSLDLYFAAWRLANPVSVPVLMWACLGAGLLFAGGWGWARSVLLARRIRQLEQQLALSGGRSRGDDWVRPSA